MMQYDNPVYSPDGYFVDQSRAGHFPYGQFGSDRNGCGWIAAYNVLRTCGEAVTADAVCAEMAQGLCFGGRFGTGPLRFARVLRTHGLRVRLTLRRATAVRRAQTCRAGAVYFWNGRQCGAHFVAFAPADAPRAQDTAAPGAQGVAPLPAPGGDTAFAPLRFFNAVLGVHNDVLTLPAFCTRHALAPVMLFFTVT